MNCDNCWWCLDGRKDDSGFLLTMGRMILCPECGNKRCPHATDHRLNCTDSNDLDQVGSMYSNYNFKTAGE